MNANSAKLSLKLPPEVAKIMPWIVSAKASGSAKQVAWAKQEYELAQEKARWREQREQEAEERRLEREQELRESEERAERQYQAWLEQKAYWATLGIHYALEDGWEEIQPTQSSQKGWRRLLSEHADLRRDKCYGMWGGRRDRIHSNQNASRKNNYRGDKPNCGRKPRKPWFKKTRR